ncbi:MAG: AsmA family protein [Phycisphaerae bacterium]|nr:AsmA family protein [Phycisphaerae bacterium]
MKKSLKILYTILIVIVVLLVIVIGAVFLFANSAIKVGVQTQASKALGVPVTLKNVDLSILGGKLELNGLDVGNPEGFGYPHLLKLNQTKVAVDIGSLTSDTVQIKQILLDGMEVYFEQKGLGSNLKTVLNNIPKTEEQPKPEPEPQKEGKKLNVQELELRNIVVHVKLMQLPGQEEPKGLIIRLDPIKLTDIGTEKDLNIGLVSQEVLAAIAVGIAKQGAGVIPDDLLGDLSSGVKKLGAMGTSVVGEGTKAITEGGKTITEEGKKITEGIKGIFGGKKDTNQ